MTAQPWRDRGRRSQRLAEVGATYAGDRGRFVFYALAVVALAGAVIAAQLGAWPVMGCAAGLAGLAAIEPRTTRAGYLRGYRAGWNGGWDDREHSAGRRVPASWDPFFSEGDSADTP